MKKFVRLTLFVIAIIAVPIMVASISSSIEVLIHYKRAGVFDDPNTYGYPSPLHFILSIACDAFGTLFAILYAVYNIKHGFGKTLYSSIALSIEDLKTAREKRALLRKKRALLRKEKKIEGLQESLDKLNQKSDE